MKIHVRRRHIKKGKRGRVRYCPVALAYLEATGTRPKVGISALYISGREPLILPRAAQKFIYRFDAGKPVKPFAFVLK